MENTIDELHAENLVRIEAQKKAAFAYDQIHQMLERITDGFFALDNEWRYTYINSVAEKFWFCNSQDMLGKKYGIALRMSNRITMSTIKLRKKILPSISKQSQPVLTHG